LRERIRNATRLERSRCLEKIRLAQRCLRPGESGLGASAFRFSSRFFFFRARLRLLRGLLLPPGVNAQAAESGDEQERDRDHKTEPTNTPFVIALF